MKPRVLITGCSSGIGRALAVELAARGYTVIATARNVESLAELPMAAKLQLDVTDDRSVAHAIAAAGEVDVLVNNAGVGFWGPVEPASGAAVQSLFDTNVFGPLRLVRAVLPGMRKRGHGAILQISSAAAHRSNALLGHYAASKAALEAYSEALRIELAPFGVAVSIVVLGAVETDFGQNRRNIVAPEYLELSKQVTRRIQANRQEAASAESVASVIADALDAGELPLRIQATPDAARLLAQRQSQTDQEWERSTLEALAACGVGFVKQSSGED